MNENVPKKPHRTKRIALRVSEEEHQILEEKAKKLGVTVSDFLRLMSSKNVELSGRESTKITRPPYNKIDPLFAAEISAIGNNINQIARALNQVKFTDDLIDKTELLAELIGINRMLKDALFNADKGGYTRHDD